MFKRDLFPMSKRPMTYDVCYPPPTGGKAHVTCKRDLCHVLKRPMSHAKETCVMCKRDYFIDYEGQHISHGSFLVKGFDFAASCHLHVKETYIMCKKVPLHVKKRPIF